MAFYSINESITSFFKDRGPLTRSDCDKHATAILGSAVRPLDTQGQFSYTVGRTDGTGDILQYRDVSSTLSLTVIDQAKQAHGKLVAGVKQLKIIQKADSALNVYMVERKSGELYIMSILDYCSGLDERKNEKLERTITSLARFFAQSCVYPKPMASDDISCHEQTVATKLELLSRTLPMRFRVKLHQLRKDLPLLYSEYPFILSHGDMISTNILVSPESGIITGILDWEEASYQPFGFELYALEEASGSMDQKGWQYFHEEMWAKERFWNEFWRASLAWSETDKKKLCISRDVGIFLRYGFKWVNGSFLSIENGDKDKLAYLDAFVKD